MSTIYGDLARKGAEAVESGFKLLFWIVFGLVVLVLGLVGTVIYLLVR